MSITHNNIYYAPEDCKKSCIKQTIAGSKLTYLNDSKENWNGQHLTLILLILLLFYVMYVCVALCYVCMCDLVVYKLVATLLLDTHRVLWQLYTE